MKTIITDKQLRKLNFTIKDPVYDKMDDQEHYRCAVIENDNVFLEVVNEYESKNNTILKQYVNIEIESVTVKEVGFESLKAIKDFVIGIGDELKKTKNT